MKNTIIKMEFLAWAIFLIPSLIHVQGAYALYKIIVAQGQTPNLIFFLTPLINIVPCFFAGRFFVELTKKRMYKKQLDRLQKRITTEYPERLEDLET